MDSVSLGEGAPTDIRHHQTMSRQGARDPMTIRGWGDETHYIGNLRISDTKDN